MVALCRVRLRNVAATGVRLSSLSTSARLAGIVIVAVRMYPASVAVHVSRFEAGCFQGIRTVIIGRDSSVGIATRYGLDGPAIESRWGRDFPHPSRPPLEPTQPPVRWVPGLSRG
jgi:hypothetical protein